MGIKICFHPRSETKFDQDYGKMYNMSLQNSFSSLGLEILFKNLIF
jgi:hypothetical protein